MSDKPQIRFNDEEGYFEASSSKAAKEFLAELRMLTGNKKKSSLLDRLHPFRSSHTVKSHFRKENKIMPRKEYIEVARKHSKLLEEGEVEEFLKHYIEETNL